MTQPDPQGARRTTRIRALAVEATPGPWRASGDTVWRPTGDGTPTDFSGVGVAYTLYRSELDPPVNTPDAAYIAALDPQTVNLLLDVIDATRAFCTDWAGDPDFGPATDRMVDALARLETP